MMEMENVLLSSEEPPTLKSNPSADETELDIDGSEGMAMYVLQSFSLTPPKIRKQPSRPALHSSPCSPLGRPNVISAHSLGPGGPFWAEAAARVAAAISACRVDWRRLCSETCRERRSARW